MNTSVPYTRLSRRTEGAPTPQQVGEVLRQRNMGGAEEMPAMAMDDQMPAGETPVPWRPGSGMPGLPNAPLPGMPGTPGLPPNALSGTVRLPAQGMAGDYDPQTEHSPSSTRSALENTLRFMQGRMKGSELSMAPRNTREQLLRLGIPPAELEGLMQTGRFGDDASNMEG